MKLIEDLGMLYPKVGSKTKYRYGIYECSACKKHVKKMSSHAQKSKTNCCSSCGHRIGATKHGEYNHRFYKTWAGEKSRCRNPKSISYKTYGARGIKFSEEFDEFTDWLSYVKTLDGYGCEGMTIDMIDNDGNYEKGNLRWANKYTQARNTRRIMSTNSTGFRGVSVNNSRNNFVAQIRVNKKLIKIGYFKNEEHAAIAYDSYVKDNNLEHTINFKKE